MNRKSTRALEEPVKEIIDNGKTALDEESEEEEDDEGWDYFKADANSKSNNLSQQKLESSGDLSNEMDYTLNPEAREFVPVSPTNDAEGDSRTESPELCLRYPVKNTQELLKEEFIASSPMKGQEKNMDDVIVPSMNDFAQEIKKRPSNIMPRFDEDECSSNNVANHELNNGNALPEESFEHDSTYASTRAVFGDASTYSFNLDDVNEESIEKQEKLDVTAAVNGDDSDVAKNDPIVDTTATENHDQQPQQNHADDFISGNSSAGDAFESEDYPSIVEKEQSSPIKEHHHHFGPDGDIFEKGASNITYGRDSGKYDAEKEVPKFDELLMPATEMNESDLVAANHSDVFNCLSFTKDPVDAVIQKMSNFDCATTDDRSWLTGDCSQEVTSPSQDLLNGTNPFAASGHNDEKENADEKEIAEPTPDVTKYHSFDAFGAAASNDHVDFQSNGARDPFQSMFGDASALKFDKDPVEETITAEKAHDVETGRPVEAAEVPFEASNNDLSAQILNSQEYDDQMRKTEDTEVVPTTSENQVPAGGAETRIGSVDMIAPYRHDCTRLGEKHDSVHEHAHKKHFEDLLPDDEHQNQDATKESDKLESELRESSSGKMLEFDLGFHDSAASASCERTFDNDAGNEFQSLMCNLVTSKTTLSAPLADNKIVEETPSMEAAAPAVDDQPAVPTSTIDNELITPTTTTDDKPVDGGLVTPPPKAALSSDPDVHISIAEAVDKLAASRSQDEQNSAEGGAVAAAAVVIGVAGVAVAGAVAAAKKESSKKPYVIRKPDPSKPAAPKAPAAKAPAAKSATGAAPKPTARSSLGSTTATTVPKKPILSSTSSNKTATTPTKSTTALARLSSSAAKSCTPRTSLTSSKTSSTTLASKPSPRPAAPKSLTSPSKPTRPLVGSVTSPRTAAAKPITNGDVTSSTVARTTTSTTRKPLSATGAVKKISSPTSSAPTSKPAVNLATRTSLAPKPKTTTTTASSADKKPIAKRPVSATSSLASSRTTTINKDSKDITNKRLSRPASAAATKTVTKTESKVNTGLVKTTANAKKISSTDQTTTSNQIDSTKMNGNA